MKPHIRLRMLGWIVIVTVYAGIRSTRVLTSAWGFTVGEALRYCARAKVWTP